MAPKRALAARSARAEVSAIAAPASDGDGDENPPSKKPAKKSRADMLAAREPVARAPTPRREPPAANLDALTICAWNLGGLRAWLKDDARREELRATALAAQPDVLFLLETKLNPGEMEDSVGAQLAEVFGAGFEMHFSSCSARKGYSGVCALVGERARKARVTKGIGECDEEGRALMLSFEAEGAAPLDVLCVYVPNSGDGLKRLDYRLDAWDPALAAWVDKRHAAGAQVVVVGDLNVAHLDADIWNWGESKSKNTAIGKNAGTTPQERESFTKLLGGGADEPRLVDAFRARHPDASGCFSYWSVRSNGRPVNRGLRLDYTLVSRAIADASALDEWGLYDAYILDECNERGDHCPVGITLVRAAP